MKIEFLKKIIENKNKKIEFSIITDLDSGESFVFEKNEDLNKNFKKYKKQINLYIDKKKNGILEGTNIFIDNYIKPIKIIIIANKMMGTY